MNCLRLPLRGDFCFTLELFTRRGIILNTDMNTPPEKKQSSIFGLPWIMSFIVLGALIVLIVTHLGEAKRFSLLVEQARPEWFALAFFLQVGTYSCAGGIWYLVARSTGYVVRFHTLARLAIVKLGIDQFVPSVGIAGNLFVVRAMKRLGLPYGLATEALLIDILSRYIAFAGAILFTLMILWLYNDVTVTILGLVMVFFIITAFVLWGIHWILKHRTWQPPAWLTKYATVRNALDAVSRVSPERVRSPKLLTKAGVFQFLIFVFDAATLWTIMRAIGSPVNFFTAFVAFVIASIAGILSLLPGGIGGFEAGSTATLVLLGVPIEAALTGTLLLRGLTLWIPLIPAVVFARHELKSR